MLVMDVVAVTTTIAGAASAVTCAIYGKARHKQYDLFLVLNGVLAG